MPSLFASVSVKTKIEVSVKGKWVSKPAIELSGTTVVIRGKLLKIAEVHDEEWMVNEVGSPNAFISALKNAGGGAVADIFAFRQKLPAMDPKYQYPFDLESVAAAQTQNFNQWWEGLPQETRKNVRRSQKRGVTISVHELDDKLLTGIVGVNNDSPIRQGRLNVHYGKSVDEVRRDHSSFLERSNFICAYSGNELIGFLKLVYRGTIASILQLTPKASHSDKRPANALVAKAVELCEQKKISHLTYGMFNYGNKHDSPLREFKIRNGFREFLVPRFYVPLTLWGSICMKAGLHRGRSKILPAPVLRFAAAVRAKIYSLRFAMSRCSSMLERPNRYRQMERSTPPAGSIS